MSSILLPAPNEAPLVYYNTIATQSGGKNRSLHLTENKIETLSASHCPRPLPWSSQKEFIMNTMLNRDTVFGIFVEDDKNHQIKSVMFTDEEINFPLGGKPPYNKAEVN